MLPSLQNSSNVRNNLARYSHKIQYIKNIKAKNKALIALQNLKNAIADIEQAHRIRTSGDLRPNLFDYHREKIFLFRKEIEKLIKENTQKKK